MASKDENFQKASEDWDLTNLYNDLASVKKKSLTPVEKLHLRGLLCGYSPSEIASIRQIDTKGIEVNLSNTLYQYVKELVGKSNGKVENWRNIAEWLEEAGYKIKSPQDFQSHDSVSLDVVVNSLDINVRKARINFKQNKIFIDINIKFSAPITSEEDTQEGFKISYENINGNGDQDV